MKIVIPKKKSKLCSIIKKRSGAVAQFFPDTDSVIIHFEGNLYDARNLQHYEDRIACAAGRAYVKYPTVAKMTLYKKDFDANFEIVGDCWPEKKYLVKLNIDALEKIAEWLE